jgi:hypothetical protein
VTAELARLRAELDQQRGRADRAEAAGRRGDAVKTNNAWCLGQNVRQMDTDQVVDLVVGLTDERDQERGRADAAEADLDIVRQHLREAEAELDALKAEVVDLDERRAS